MFPRILLHRLQAVLLLVLLGNRVPYFEGVEELTRLLPVIQHAQWGHPGSGQIRPK